MGFDNLCNTTLVLSLNIQSNTLPTPSGTTTTTQSSPKSSSTPHKSSNNNNNNNHSFFNILEPSLTLGLSRGCATPTPTPTPTGGGGGNSDRYRQASPNSAVSSFSNVSVKREREFGSEEVEIERGSARIVDEDEDSYNTRKKLRLTKEQSALLEDSFKEHSTLNPKQKQALARQLNLRPRQVEVWFQNRRARTKLKQTEVDCEFLRKCCETLTDENKRLHKELQELKALKLAQPFYMQIPAATLSMCPSCERITGTGGEAVANTPIAPFAISAAKSHHHLYNPFTNPSAAC